jgi:RsmE family RNA methyltransferase
MAEGDAAHLFDGSGQEFRATLVEVGKKRVVVQIDEQFAGQVESPLQIHLGQGLSRGERMDWAIQKATELGVEKSPRSSASAAKSGSRTSAPTNACCTGARSRSAPASNAGVHGCR